MMRDVIYFASNNPRTIAAIKERFGIPFGVSVNGETVLPEGFDVDDAELREVERRGFIQLRRKDVKVKNEE